MSPFPQGSTIGMLGGGQLGRMFAVAAKRLGYSVVVLDPTENSPAAQVSDVQIIAEYSDRDAALQLAEQANVVTYEFENVPVDIVQLISETTPVAPGAKLLEVAQNRLREKEFASSASIGTAPFAAVQNYSSGVSSADVQTALQQVGLPAVIKTTTLGYDGKGQWVVHSEEEVAAALNQAGGTELIWEGLVDLQTEISVVATRGQDGSFVTYPIGENEHRNNILYRSVVPAVVSEEIITRAKEIAQTIGEQLSVVGTYTVELFVTKQGEVLFNEIAPRPHNSGHYTIEGCETSQFENQVRAVCGMPLGPTDLRSPAVVMQNILGDGSGNELQGVETLEQQEGVSVHLYGKAEAKEGRKMGHITIVGKNTSEVIDIANTIDTTLHWA